MLFNSASFIFLYMPIVFIGMFWLARHSHRMAALWLGLASLAFYAVWDARFVLLLLASITFNYGMGYWIGIKRTTDSKQAKYSLVAAITVNLILLGYFKYTNFFITSTNQFIGSHIPALDIILPLGISFFTFTQIAFLVDTYLGIAREYNFIHYLLFVTYFPHLIAGPILHHKQMMPQFADPLTYQMNAEKIGIGLSIFFIGLAKKVVLADSLATYATPVFAAADKGSLITFFDGWAGALSYTFQLYFDFSGYSDMAIGLSLLFGVSLPINFSSPYKAYNIIEFWRRWHVTLSNFLRDYLYIPLGGNRHGKLSRYRNLMITMLLGGLWHGANWTFVLWGGLHGLYLAINHFWHEIRNRFGFPFRKASLIGRVLGIFLTFVFVVLAWVIFRAQTIKGAQAILEGMFGVNGFVFPERVAEIIPAARNYVSLVETMPLLGNGTVLGIFVQLCLLGVSFFICWWCPATQSMSQRARLLAITLSFGFVVQAVLFGHAPSEFLYFQF
jgi:alginate O-acetyltransferase complex protein AlgI